MAPPALSRTESTLPPIKVWARARATKRLVTSSKAAFWECTMSRRAQIAFLRMVLLLALGCGSGTCEVTGTVTFDGQPVAHGDILLTDVEGRLGPDYGKIEDGRFVLQAKPGRKRVEIRASREVPDKKPRWARTLKITSLAATTRRLSLLPASHPDAKTIGI